MTFLLILLVASALLITATLRSVAHDDRGHRAPPASHNRDQDFLPPAQF